MKTEHEFRIDAANALNEKFLFMDKINLEWNAQEDLVITHETIDDILKTREDFWNERGKAIQEDNYLEIQRSQVLKGQKRYNHYIVELKGKCYWNSELA